MLLIRKSEKEILYTENGNFDLQKWPFVIPPSWGVQAVLHYRQDIEEQEENGEDGALSVGNDVGIIHAFPRADGQHPLPRSIIQPALILNFAYYKRIVAMTGDVEVLIIGDVCYLRVKQTKSALILTKDGDHFVCPNRKKKGNCTKKAFLQYPVTDAEAVRKYIRTQLNSCVRHNYLFPGEDGFRQPPDLSTPKRSREVAAHEGALNPITLRSRRTLPERH